MVYIVLIRHGETDANLHRIIQGGDLDTELNNTGKKQAEKCGKFLSKHFTFGKIICSPMIRTKQTAEIVCKELNFNISQIEYDENLIEKKHGKKIAGKTQQELYSMPKIGSKVKKLDDQIAKFNIIERGGKKWEELEDQVMVLTGGEPFDQFRKRVKKVIAFINT